jgi:hypothetical protein
VVFSVERVKAAYRSYSNQERIQENRKLYLYIVLLYVTFSIIYLPFTDFFPDHFYFTLSTVLTVIADSFLPIVIIIVANILVFVKLKRNLYQLRNNMTTRFSQSRDSNEGIQMNRLNSNTQSFQLISNTLLQQQQQQGSCYPMLRTRKDEMRRTAVTLFAITFEFCFFNIPYAVYMIITLVNEGFDLSWTSGLDSFGKISFQLNLLNQSANFVLYFLHFDSFRNEFLHLIKDFFKCYRCFKCAFCK